MINDIDSPIFLGLSGKALTGKSSVAESLAPLVMAKEDDEDSPEYIRWIKIDLAAPLYELATIRQLVDGESAEDRCLYEIHKVLVKIFGGSPLYGAPPYDELVDLVYEIAHCPCEKEGKARSFLQYVGTDVLRNSYPDVWINYLARSAKDEHRMYLRECELLDKNPGGFGVVIGDLRFKNEAEFIKAQSKGFLVKYTASPEVCQDRSERRDGFRVSFEQLTHSSENDLNDYSDSDYDLVLDTAQLSIKEQTNITIEALRKKVNILAL